MSEERPYLQIPLPSEEQRRLFDEWVRKRMEEQEEKEEDRVIVIDI
jgi:hypothetical protein